MCGESGGLKLSIWPEKIEPNRSAVVVAMWYSQHARSLSMFNIAAVSMMLKNTSGDLPCDPTLLISLHQSVIGTLHCLLNTFSEFARQQTAGTGVECATGTMPMIC